MTLGGHSQRGHAELRLRLTFHGVGVGGLPTPAPLTFANAGAEETRRAATSIANVIAALDI